MDKIININNNDSKPIFPGWEPKKIKDKKYDNLEVEVIERTIKGKILKITETISCPVCESVNEIIDATARPSDDTKLVMCCGYCGSTFSIEVKDRQLFPLLNRIKPIE